MDILEPNGLSHQMQARVASAARKHRRFIRFLFVFVLANGLSHEATSAPSSRGPVDREAKPSLWMVSPGPTGVSTHNQLGNAQPFNVSIDDTAAEVHPGRQSFRGMAPGMRKVIISCPSAGTAYTATVAKDGSFSADVDVPDAGGPLTIEVSAWDRDKEPQININARFDLFVIGKSRKYNASPASKTDPTAGLKLAWSDEFDRPLSLSSSRHQDATWFAGGKPSSTGSQYSDAFFVSATDRRNPYFLKDGFLRMRAVYVPPNAYRPKGMWWSGHLSSGFPDESASVQFREGYAEVRMKTPIGPGTWPGFWLLDSASTLPSRGYGAVEIDVIEGYGHDPKWYMATQNLWPGRDNPTEPHQYGTHQVFRDKSNIDGFHTYGIRLTKSEAVWYYDRGEVYRMPLYRAQVVSPFFIMVDMGMGGGWPSTAPPAGYYDLWVDYVRVYE